MNSADMIAKNVFERELRYIEMQISNLSSQDDCDFTEARLAQEKIWELEEIAGYLRKRIAGLV